jgi:hypothetical protein
MQERIPKSWTNKDVILARAGAESTELVTLEEVNELGLAYTYKSGDVKGASVFVPWSSVSWLRPPIPADLQEDEG